MHALGFTRTFTKVESRRKSCYLFFLALVMVFTLCVEALADGQNGDIVVLYTNDGH